MARKNITYLSPSTLTTTLFTWAYYVSEYKAPYRTFLLNVKTVLLQHVLQFQLVDKQGFKIMVLLEDMTSALIVGRIMGCTILIATKNDIKVRRLRHVIYIIFSMILYLCSLIVLNVKILIHIHEDSKSMFILYTRIVLYYLCLFADSILTTLWNWRFRSVFSHLRNFDRVTKFHDSSTRIKFRIVCCILVVLKIFYSTVIAYLTYRTETRIPIYRGILYFAIHLCIDIQMLIFACILCLIGTRFRHLCNMVEFFRAEGKLIATDLSNGPFTLQQIWWLHCTLVKACEMINSVYAIQLLLWISTMSFNVLSRIYWFNVYKLSNYGKLRESILAIGSGWNLVLIITACHVTAQQANRVGQLIFSPDSAVPMKGIFQEENLQAAAYFQLRKVYFSTIASIIRVDMPLLLSIFSVLTTYIVILT